MPLSDLEQAIAVRRRELDQLAGEARSVLQRGKDLAIEIADLEQQVTTLDKSTILLNGIAEDTQLQAQHNIEELVTRGLQTIFDESLSFHILQSTKGKSAAVEFVVRTQLLNGQAVDTPVMDARGGGLAATIGFLLRVVVMLLRKQENILVLDETFAMVSDEYLPALGEFVRQLVDKTGLQVVMVTHQSSGKSLLTRCIASRSRTGRRRVLPNHANNPKVYVKVRLQDEPSTYAHILVYQVTHGHRPVEILHTCDYPRCFEVSHLRGGTHAENMQDMAAKGRHDYPTGEQAFNWQGGASLDMPSYHASWRARNREKLAAKAAKKEERRMMTEAAPKKVLFTASALGMHNDCLAANDLCESCWEIMVRAIGHHYGKYGSPSAAAAAYIADLEAGA
jgi:hypothetical protein